MDHQEDFVDIQDKDVLMVALSRVEHAQMDYKGGNLDSRLLHGMLYPSQPQRLSPRLRHLRHRTLHRDRKNQTRTFGGEVVAPEQGRHAGLSVFVPAEVGCDRVGLLAWERCRSDWCSRLYHDPIGLFVHHHDTGGLVMTPVQDIAGVKRPRNLGLWRFEIEAESVYLCALEQKMFRRRCQTRICQTWRLYSRVVAQP